MQAAVAFEATQADPRTPLEEPKTRVEERARLPAAARRLAVLAAASLAIAGLTWRATTGLGWLAAMAILVGLVVGGVARGKPGATGWALAATTLWLAGVVCWRASDWALATALPASCVALIALALVCARRLRALRPEALGGSALLALLLVPRGAVAAARWPGQALGGRTRSQAAGVGRGLLLGLPLALVFVAILAADASFRGALSSLVAHSGSFASSTLWSLFVFAELALAAAVLLELRRAADAAADLAPSGPVPRAPYRMADGDTIVSPRARPRRPMTPTTWGVALSQVVAVFAVYGAANARSLFAGHAFFRAHGTPTYAATVHEGFVQVALATLLAVACVVAGHALMRTPASDRTPGGRALVAIELALLGLAGLALLSSAHRLSLYEEAYGYTTARLGVRCFQTVVAGLLALTAARCIARAWRGWSTALAWSGVLAALGVGSVDAERWVADRNIERATRTGRMDVAYLASLSEDARPSLARARFALGRYDAAPVFAEVWAQADGERSSDWRSWRGLGWRWTHR
jgi:hypothetical protein